MTAQVEPLLALEVVVHGTVNGNERSDTTPGSLGTEPLYLSVIRTDAFA